MRMYRGPSSARGGPIALILPLEYLEPPAQFFPLVVVLLNESRYVTSIVHHLEIVQMESQRSAAAAHNTAHQLPDHVSAISVERPQTVNVAHVTRACMGSADIDLDEQA